ncbi:sodium:solute symporter family protein [Acetomicrobium hydrogeniformans]|uniref:Sodium:solute symporter family protein n=1 Tax=Acetomicrobium hydrogeniformans TaxID=649746 RepID=A0A7V7BXN8_9BACT|nr:sodium:solute symporter family protein [Acetomicrobium hydrogeniformans]HHZ03493.1 sodium:solute symporter family protein [Acetomicrobium hydrogeniformans]
MFFLSVVITLIFVISIGVIASGKKIDEEGYSLAGRRASPFAVSGILLGALVGGASTVGTAEMAYVYGLSAWWFTLGGGIGCLLLALFIAEPLRKSKVTTLAQFLSNHYGLRMSRLAVVGSALGTLMAVVAQFLASSALLSAIVPLPSWALSLLVAFLILLFIYSGGTKSYSAIGQTKLILLYITLIACGVVAYGMGHTPWALIRELPRFPYFSLFARGILKESNACLSLIVGTLGTQIYAQAILSASNESTAKKGALLSAILMPPIGLLGIWIGLALRREGVIIEPSQALPYFLYNYFPKVFSGVAWATLFITSLGTAAGLSLGVATTVSYDLFVSFKKITSSRVSLLVNRLSLLAVILIAFIASLKAAGSFILQWSYLSMGLRGAGVFVPLLAMVLYGRLSPSMAFASGAVGIGTACLWPLLELPGEGILMGVFFSALLMLFDIFQRGRIKEKASL